MEESSSVQPSSSNVFGGKAFSCLSTISYVNPNGFPISSSVLKPPNLPKLMLLNKSYDKIRNMGEFDCMQWLPAPLFVHLDHPNFACWQFEHDVVIQLDS